MEGDFFGVWSVCNFGGFILQSTNVHFKADAWQVALFLFFKFSSFGSPPGEK